MKTNFDLVKDKSVVMDEDNNSFTPYKIFPTVKDFVDFLNLPVAEKILDDAEKRYIKNIVRPFKNRVTSICKRQYDGMYEYIVIIYEDIYHDGSMTERRIYLPNFRANTMYKGMKLEEHYTLADLGITFKE